MAHVTPERRATWTRRAVVASGLACVGAAYAASRDTVAKHSLASGNPRGLLGAADLYAFPGKRAETTVIAVTWPRSWTAHDTSADAVLRLHAGSRNWSVKVGDQTAKVDTWEQDGCQFFTGGTHSHAMLDTDIQQAVVMEAPRERIAGAVDIWAERVTPTSRYRFGAPFLAALISADRPLRQRYHSSSPAQDRQLLWGQLSATYGRRLASAVLPDVLHYDTNLPSGFTFAARNGRHPGEASEDVVNSILASLSDSRAA